MSNLMFFLLGIIIALGGMKLWESLWSFRAQRLQDYEASASAPTLPEILGRRFEAHGLIFDYTGRAKSRFHAEMSGAFDGEGGTLKERFTYDGGRVDRREWTIKLDVDGHRFTATAPDVIGEANGELRGAVLRMTYRLQLPERAGGHVLDVVDWLYLMEDGAIVNRSEMRKFGFRAAELVAVFRPIADGSGMPAVATE